MADDNELENLFAQARQESSGMPDDLAVRIETDAELVRLKRLKAAKRPELRAWGKVIEGIGGLRVLGGLAAACAAGIWIGFFAPAFLPDPANLFLPQEATFLMAELNLDTEYLEGTE
ncbi:hypothetical protein [Ruegeria arenilitoris]|uniref:hypothetical protein n=1 Tax=Ruegeria arenilitoris TaxID=1173585 RepID=UPI00147FA6F0|nr:hypothetical protein [Ruegeria arenilitoris]